MNVFLSSSHIWDSFNLLDRARLGKQRVELKQILIALEKGGAWSNHPATTMWRGHLGFVAQMGIVCCTVWKRRGYKDTMLPWFTCKAEEHALTGTRPAWLTDDCPFFDDVKANLVRKDPIYYRRFWPNIEPKEGYKWPQS